MRFVAVEDSQINLTSLNMATGEADTSVDLKYSKDGVTWTQYDFNPIPLAAGETLYLKGNNENGFSNEQRICIFGDLSTMGIPSTPSTGKFECHGNIMSLLYGDEFEDKTTIPNASCFMYMFAMCNGLLTSPELPATTLADRCYYDMFSGCESLTKAPELPATTLADDCYAYMFINCTSLTTAPELHATTLAKRCYMAMFYGCTNLNHITMLVTDISAEDCFNGWVEDVSSTGIFVKHPDATGTNFIEVCVPKGWTVIDYDFNN